MPTAYQENRRYFHAAYESKKYPWSNVYCLVVEKFLEDILNCGGGVSSILDLGCGEGANVRMAAQKGLYAVGLDREPLAIQTAEQLAFNEGLGERIKFLVSDALALPFPAHSFDIVLDHGCFHHLKKSDQKTYLKNIDTILKQRGYFIMEVFSREHKGYGTVPRRGWHIKQGAYRRFFSQEEIQNFLGGKFEILTIQEKRGETAGDWHILARKKY